MSVCFCKYFLGSNKHLLMIRYRILQQSYKLCPPFFAFFPTDAAEPTFSGWTWASACGCRCAVCVRACGTFSTGAGAEQTWIRAPTTMQVRTAPPLVQRAHTPTHARSRSQTASCRSLHDVRAIKVVSLERPDAQMKGLSFKQSELLGRPLIADGQTGSKPLAGKLHRPAGQTVTEGGAVWQHFHITVFSKIISFFFLVFNFLMKECPDVNFFLKRKDITAVDWL